MQSADVFKKENVTYSEQRCFGIEIVACWCGELGKSALLLRLCSSTSTILRFVSLGKGTELSKHTTYKDPLLNITDVALSSYCSRQVDRDDFNLRIQNFPQLVIAFQSLLCTFYNPLKIKYNGVRLQF